MHTRRGSRAAISTVIGAIFFVLIVFLVFTSTVLVFESFTGYANSFKQVNQQDIQNKATSIGISDLVFGGMTSPTASESLAPTLQNSPPTRSLLPIANMNFTNGMKGWTFARQYRIVRDNGIVNNTFLNVFPGITGFSLRVYNGDPVASGSLITKVSLLVDPRFALSSGGVPLPQPSCPSCVPAGFNAPVASGNTIVWSATPGNGLLAGTKPVLFNWTALATAVPGRYYHSVTLTWQTTFLGVPLTASGSATIQTVVVTAGPGGVSAPRVCAPSPPPSFNICAEPAGVVPGGAFGGYDPLSNNIGSESGPGSVYLNFQPTLNGNTINASEQLTANMNFTSAFYLDTATGNALTTAGSPDSLNFGYSLDRVLAPPNPVVSIQAYLAQLDSSGSIVNSVLINSTVPTQLSGSNVNSSGWITCSPSVTPCRWLSFNPNSLAAVQCPVATSYCEPTWTWSAGVYELIISVTAGLQGTGPGVYYPPSLMMHFDDIGLSLQESSSSYYVDNSIQAQTGLFYPSKAACGGANPSCLIEIPSSADPTEVQSIHLTAQLALTPTAGTNVTAYVFIADVARSTQEPLWVEIGQVTFSSSVTLNTVIPSSSSSIYIDRSGDICSNICVRIYAIGSGAVFSGLDATVSVVVQTWKQSALVISVLNNATFPVQLGSVYVAGPDGVSNINLHKYTSGCPGTPASSCYEWMNGGQLLQIPLTYTWATGQEYVVTVTTAKGIVLSETFISP